MKEWQCPQVGICLEERAVTKPLVPQNGRVGWALLSSVFQRCGESGLLEKAEAREMRGARDRKHDDDSDLSWASKQKECELGRAEPQCCPGPAVGPQIKDSVSTSLSPPQPWTPAKDKVRRGSSWAPGPPWSPTFPQSSSKAWGPQGGSLQTGPPHQVHQLMPLVQWTGTAWGEGTH